MHHHWRDGVSNASQPGSSLLRPQLGRKQEAMPWERTAIAHLRTLFMPPLCGDGGGALHISTVYRRLLAPPAAPLGTCDGIPSSVACPSSASFDAGLQERWSVVRKTVGWTPQQRRLPGQRILLRRPAGVGDFAFRRDFMDYRRNVKYAFHSVERIHRSNVQDAKHGLQITAATTDTRAARCPNEDGMTAARRVSTARGVRTKTAGATAPSRTAWSCGGDSRLNEISSLTHKARAHRNCRRQSSSSAAASCKGFLRLTGGKSG